MDGLRGIMLSEISHMKKANTVWFHSYVESEKQDKSMNRTEQNRLTDAKNKQVVARGKRIGGMSEIVREINWYKLVVTK